MTEKTIWVRVGASADIERAMKWVRRLAKAEGQTVLLSIKGGLSSA